MPDLSYPHYQLQADGPNETGFRLTVVIQDGVGGPLPGMTSQGVLEALKQRLAESGDGVTVRLTKHDVTATDL
ncbi:hypothetical protein SUDANB1_00484 [Streptomyces sp. enrichment culture]|uniref:hypothetical protein n=1 Tax=Streptomyces sp. enrichment culture TaxID=1795815 RepID=UPI003F57F828